jgi:hypothetical protein
MSTDSMGPALVGVGCVLLLVLAVIVLVRYGRRRQAELDERAAGYGWAVIGKVGLPTPLTAVIRRGTVHRVWHRSTAAGPEWCIWHYWSTSSGFGKDSSTKRHNRTDFVAAVPGRALPNLKLTRRTSLGAAIRPVRGVGTGDPEFDRRFLIAPANGPGATVVGPRIRSMMLAGDLPAWHLAGNFVFFAVDSAPTGRMFEVWSGRAPALAAELAQG